MYIYRVNPMGPTFLGKHEASLQQQVPDRLVGEQNHVTPRELDHVF